MDVESLLERWGRHWALDPTVYRCEECGTALAGTHEDCPECGGDISAEGTAAAVDFWRPM